VRLVFAMHLSGVMYARAKQMFIGMAPMYVLSAQSDSVSCPFHILYLYVCAYLGLSSSLPFFRSLQFLKATST